MHNGGMCGCPHHKVNKLLALLAWVAGILFFWTSWSESMVWGFNSAYYAWAVVVLVLLAKISMFCGCCGMGGSKMMNGKMCSHEAGCKCGDCDRCC